MNYFIFDCNDNVVGNPKGYATFRGAASQEANPRSPARRAIWAAFDAREAAEIAAGVPKHEQRRNICSIRQENEYSLKVSQA
jgi:hypothetical protein